MTLGGGNSIEVGMVLSCAQELMLLVKLNGEKSSQSAHAL